MKPKQLKKTTLLIISILSVLLFLPVFTFADMGFHPEATFTVTVDEEPFTNALISLQSCEPGKRYSASDYSIAGLGTSSFSFDNNLLANVLEPDEEGNYLSKEEIESFFTEQDPLYAGSVVLTWSEVQLQQAREFVLDSFDEQGQCYWQPSERSFTNCENITCKVAYSVPASFRIKLLDLETGKTYVTQTIQSEGLNTEFSVDFNSSGGREIIGKLPMEERAVNNPYLIVIFLMVLILNMALELIAAIILAYFILKVSIKKIIAPLLLGNVITHPFVLIIPLLFDFGIALIILLCLEILAVLVEAFLIKRMAKISWKQALIISFISNFVSFFIGALVPVVGMRIVL